MQDFTSLPSDSMKNRLDETRDFLTTVGDTTIDIFKAKVSDVTPFLGLTLGLWKSCNEIRDLLYQKKLNNFLNGLVGDTTQKSRDEFIRRLQAKNEYSRLGQTILLLIEKSNDIDKPAIIGKIIAACVNGDIDLDRSLRLSYMIDRCYIQDLNILRKFKEGIALKDKENHEQLYAIGFLTTTGIVAGDDNDNGYFMNTFKLTSYGKDIIRYGLNGRV